MRERPLALVFAALLLGVGQMPPTGLGDDGPAATPSPTPEALLLRYAPKPGTLLHYDGVERLVSSIRTPKRSGTSDTEAPYHTTFAVLSATPDGGFRLLSSSTYAPIIPKRLIDNGQDVTEKQSAATIASFGKRRATLDLTTQDARGVEPPDPAPAEYNDALRAILSDIEILPEERIAPGGVWTREWRAGPLACRADYRLEKIETVDGVGRVAVCTGGLSVVADDLGEATPKFERVQSSLRLRLDEGIIDSFECSCHYRTRGREAEDEPFEQEITIGNSWRLVRSEMLDPAGRTALESEGASISKAIAAREMDDPGGALAAFEAFAAAAPDSRWAGPARDEAAALREAFPHLGTMLPEPVIAEWLNGGPHTLEALKGRVVVIDFWATWCLPCKKSVARLKQLHKELKGDGLVILGVTSYDEYQNAASLRAWIKEHAVPYVVALDGDRATAKACGVASPPYTLVIGRGGKVEWEGEPLDLDRMEAAVRRASRTE